MKRSTRVTTQIIIFLFFMMAAGTGFAGNTGKELRLAPAEKKALNTFFSNFSEVFVKPFSNGSIADADLIRFGVSHNYRNNEKLFAKTGKENQAKIKAGYVDESVNKYFGKRIKKHQSVEGIEYKNGWYYIPPASGEAFIFSQVANLYDSGNNRYTATVNVYSAGSGWTGNVHGSVKEWKADNDIPELAEVMNAVLQKVTEKGKSRYILLEYTKVK